MPEVRAKGVLWQGAQASAALKGPVPVALTGPNARGER